MKVESELRLEWMELDEAMELLTRRIALIGNHPRFGEALGHRAEKCTRFSASDDAQVIAKALDATRKMDPFFGPML